MTLKPVLPALGLLGVVASVASAQTPSGPSFSLVFREVAFSACVDFLMDPAAATRQLDPGYRIIPAGSFTPLAPVLRREIEGDTVHIGWVAAQVCFIESPAISVEGTVLTPDKKMGGQEVVGYWAIAASRSDASFRPDQWFAVNLWTNDWHLDRLSNTAYIPMSVFKRALAPIPESNNHHYEIRIGKTVLSWDGGLIGRDSTETTTSLESDLVFEGERGIPWSATVQTRPRWNRSLPGIFRVEGKDDMAKALKASPIRIFGPMRFGGDARIDFYRKGASGASGSGG